MIVIIEHKNIINVEQGIRAARQHGHLCGENMTKDALMRQISGRGNAAMMRERGPGPGIDTDTDTGHQLRYPGTKVMSQQTGPQQPQHATAAEIQ